MGHLQWYVGELRTGRITATLPLVAPQWQLQLDDAGTLQGTLTLADPEVAALKPRTIAEPARTFLAAAWIDDQGGETFLEAGPIWSHSYDDQTHQLRIGAGGLWTYYDHRKVMPVLASGQNPAQVSAAALGLSLGSIAAHLVQLAHTHTHGSLPVVLPADISGTDSRTYPGYELAVIGQQLRELSQLEGGPEIAFLPRRTSTNPRFLEWVMQVGTPTQPFLAQPGADWVWDHSVDQSPVSQINVDVDGTRVAGRVWVPGYGAAEARLIGAVDYAPTTAGGWPLLELEQSGKDAVEDLAVLRSIAVQAARAASAPWQTMTLKVRTDRYPHPGVYRPGHWAQVIVPDAHPYLEAGPHRGRIVQVAGDGGQEITVQFQPERATAGSGSPTFTTGGSAGSGTGGTGDGDDDGGGTGGGTTTPTAVQIGGTSYPLAAVNPTDTTNPAGVGYPGLRGPDQMVIYQDPLEATPTNQWGIEVTVSADGIVTARNDRELAADTNPTPVPPTGYVLSGHGLGAQFLRSTATVGSTVTLIGGTAGGTGGTGSTGGTTGGTTPGAAAVALWGTPTSGLQWHSGAWTSDMRADRATRWGTWRGAPNDVSTVYPAYANWTELADSGWLFGTDAAGIGLGGFSGKLNLGIPLLTHADTTGDFSSVLNGSHDAAFTAIAQAASTAGFASRTWVRLGIEVNGNWFPNSVTWANAANYRAACQRVVGLFRAVHSGFRFGPDISAGQLLGGAPGGTTPAQVLDALWPGDAYADGWGIDTYDHWHLAVPNAAAMANHLRPTQGIGIGHVADWLRAHGGNKVLVIPEWGCATYTEGGGDNPTYIELMHGWFADNLDVLAMECYFNEPYLNVLNSLWNEFGDPQQCPTAGTKYKELFTSTSGSTGGGTTGGGSTGSTPYPTKVVRAYKVIWDIDTPVTAVPANATEIALAFGQGTPPTLTGYTTAGQAAFLAALAARRNSGQKIILSLGGMDGLINISNRTAILSGIAAIKAELDQAGAGLDGIDWDLEGSATLGASDAVAISAALKAAYGANFAITMAPNGTNQAQYRTAAAQMHAAGCLDWIGQQYYDADVTLAAAKNNIQLYLNAGIPASKLAIGMSVAPNFPGGGYWTQQQCIDYVTDIRNTYGITRVYLWATNAGFANGSAATWTANMRAVLGL